MSDTFTFPGTSVTVNRFGYGAMQLAGKGVFGPPADREAALAVLREAVSLGVDHIDTSDFYGPHVTNQIVREALEPYPEGLVIVTKVGAKRSAAGDWLPALSPEELTSAVHDNLRNLGLDALDVVNLRIHDGLKSADASIADMLGVLIDLKAKGLIREIGMSNASAKQIDEARALTSIVCVQNHYNLAHRDDDALIDDLAKKGVAYVPFFPLGGFTPLQSSTLDEAAKALDASPMQIALAWLLQRADNILLIPGTSSLTHLHDNYKAISLEIPPDLLQKLDAIAARP